MRVDLKGLVLCGILFSESMLYANVVSGLLMVHPQLLSQLG